MVPAGSAVSGRAEAVGHDHPGCAPGNGVELAESEIAATFRLLLRVKAWMDAECAPDGYNIGWNCGRTGGQEVFHAHMHVISRFKQEPPAGTGIRSLLKSEADR